MAATAVLAFSVFGGDTVGALGGGGGGGRVFEVAGGGGGGA